MVFLMRLLCRKCGVDITELIPIEYLDFDTSYFINMFDMTTAQGFVADLVPVVKTGVVRVHIRFSQETVYDLQLIALGLFNSRIQINNARQISMSYS